MTQRVGAPALANSVRSRVHYAGSLAPPNTPRRGSSTMYAGRPAAAASRASGAYAIGLTSDPGKNSSLTAETVDALEGEKCHTPPSCPTTAVLSERTAARASSDARKATSDHTTKITVADTPTVTHTRRMRNQSGFRFIAALTSHRAREFRNDCAQSTTTANPVSVDCFPSWEYICP